VIERTNQEDNRLAAILGRGYPGARKTSSQREAFALGRLTERGREPGLR